MRVYRQEDPLPKRGFTVYACLLADAAAHVSDGEFTAIFMPPAMSLSGSVFGYADSTCQGISNAQRQDCSTTVWVQDLADPRGLPLTVHSAGPTKDAFVKVGSLRATKRGSVAWIACPARGDPVADAGTRSPNCVRPGDRNSVYKIDKSDGHVRLVDRGSKIDPSSLRRSGSTITWRNAGNRRSSTIE